MGLTAMIVCASCGRSESHHIQPPSDSDLGVCCLPRTAGEPIPTPEMGPDGRPLTVTWQSPSYECQSLTCISYNGSDAYCTRECNVDGDCASDNYKCIEVAPPITLPNQVDAWRVCANPTLAQCVTP
jgi:hypothetical protein